MIQPPVLLPLPRHIDMAEGVVSFADRQLILIDTDHPQSLLFSANRIQRALADQLSVKYEITASRAAPAEYVCIILRLDPEINTNPQGYTLQISTGDVLITANDEAGLFYGCCTFIQLLQYYHSSWDEISILPPGTLPCMKVSDWPDFLYRAYLLDVSRDKVPTMQTLYDLVDLLAAWKINQLQLYTEHTFAYQNHRDVWTNASPFTGGEILALDAYCRERYIELVPNQNSFGHLEHWLKLPRYRELAEAPAGFDLPWGEQHADPYGLCPIDPRSISFISGLYDELLPHFSSRQFNVGCDETFDLGQGRSKDTCTRLGVGHVYLDFLLKIYHQVKQRGFTMQFWGDIVMTYPGLVDELPRDCVALEWGYEADHPFDEHGRKFAQAGLPFYVCPGTSAWNSVAGRTDNCLKNISNAAIYGRKHGAIGLLNTDWGDDGHWQVLPVSYLGIAAGAAYAWGYDANHDLDIRTALNIYAFQDPSNHLGTVAFDLGNAYHQVGIEPENSSALFEILQRPISSWKDYFSPETADQVFPLALSQIDQIASNIPNSRSHRPDRDLLLREFKLTANLLRHACKRGMFGFGSSLLSPTMLAEDLKDIIAEYKQIWLSRNRPGGLNDSLAHFDITLNDYL